MKRRLYRLRVTWVLFFPIDRGMLLVARRDELSCAIESSDSLAVSEKKGDKDVVGQLSFRKKHFICSAGGASSAEFIKAHGES